MLDLVDTLARTLGVFGYLVLGVAALIEYVFPPFPGDTVTLLGGAYVARGERSMALVLAALTLGSMVGIVATWRVGLALGGRLVHLEAGRRVMGLDAVQLHRAQQLMRERGAWLLVINRFLPSFRSVLFVAAGASGVPLSHTLLFGTASALAFNTLLVSVGAALGSNAEAVAEFLRTYRSATVVVLALVVLGVGGRFLWRRGRGRGAP